MITAFFVESITLSKYNLFLHSRQHFLNELLSCLILYADNVQKGVKKHNFNF